jgi:hypothetical protein
MRVRQCTLLVLLLPYCALAVPMIQPNRTVRNYTYDWRDEKEFFGLKGEPFGARFLNASGGGFAGTRLQCVHLLQVCRQGISVDF